MAKTNKDKQCYTKHIEERQTIPWPKPTFDVFCITLFVLVGFGHGIVWGSSMCFVQHCLTLLVLAMVWSDVLRCVLYNIGQTMLYKRHRRTSDNTMAKTKKDKQCYTKHIEERQTIPWPKPTRTNNVIQNTSKNVRQYHDQNQQGQTMLYKTHRRTSDNTMAKTVCPCMFWPWYCLTFFDVFCITLFVLVGFGHGIVWRSSMCFA
jgi:hypothetical protein